MIPIDFTGKVVIVTGGGRGVGLGITQRFLDAGADVVICGRNEPETLPSSDGRSAVFIACDVRVTDQIDALVEATIERFGRLDVMIPNAGGAPYADADTASPRFHEKIIHLNLTAPLHCAQRANAAMQQQDDGGVVLFIGSVSAYRPSPGTAAYGGAKAGLLSLTESLAVEWAPRVRVVTVAAGMVKTEQAHLHYGSDAGIAAAESTVPLGRLAEPADVGNACLFFASPLASYASGVEILLHGGGEAPAFLDAVKNAEASSD